MRNPAIGLLVQLIKRGPSSQLPKRNILNLGITNMQNNETGSLFLTIYVNDLFKMYQKTQRKIGNCYKTIGETLQESNIGKVVLYKAP